MIFTRKTISTSHSTQQILNTSPSITTLRTPKLSPATTPPPPPVLPKMVWGRYFWEYFHTLAEKVSPVDFPRIRAELLNHIYVVCNYLLCPVCVEHAISYLKKINFNAIQTKEQLIIMLFDFHNSVNQRKGYPIFTVQMLHDKYSAANLANVSGQFFKIFENQYKTGFKQLTDSLHRVHISAQLRSWLIANIHCFDLSSTSALPSPSV